MAPAEWGGPRWPLRSGGALQSGGPCRVGSVLPAVAQLFLDCLPRSTATVYLAAMHEGRLCAHSLGSVFHMTHCGFTSPPSLPPLHSTSRPYPAWRCLQRAPFASSSSSSSIALVLLPHSPLRTWVRCSRPGSSTTAEWAAAAWPQAGRRCRARWRCWPACCTCCTRRPPTGERPLRPEGEGWWRGTAPTGIPEKSRRGRSWWLGQPWPANALGLGARRAQYKYRGKSAMQVNYSVFGISPRAADPEWDLQ